MKISNQNLLLGLAFIVSILWQPSHYFFMHHGMTMNFGVHTMVTIIPFLSIIFALNRAKLS